jgi:tRNA G10  N-methylase Trm11
MDPGRAGDTATPGWASFRAQNASWQMTSAKAGLGPRRVEHPEWRSFVTPKSLRRTPVHRWFVFPHSFSEELVEALASEWCLGSEDWLLDPFVGAGTTLVAGQRLGIPALGFDLSPLAVFSSTAKTAQVEARQLRDSWTRLKRHFSSAAFPASLTREQDVLRRAFDARTLSTLLAYWQAIRSRVRNPSVRVLIQLGFIGVMPRYSRLVSKGGWLTETSPELEIRSFVEILEERIRMMAADLARRPEMGAPAICGLADARWLPVADDAIGAVITSPPYPNRHDYTRVFGVELAFAFLDTNATKALRYQSFSSHPEAKPKRPESVSAYREPPSLSETLQRIGDLIDDPRAKQRIPNMLAGYFVDLYCSLKEVKRVLKPGARAAYVVGNVQYCGIALEVDQLLCEIAGQVGLSCDEVRVARVRGNSAQQMGLYGRQPARESVVIVRKPSLTRLAPSESDSHVRRRT